MLGGIETLPNDRLRRPLIESQQAPTAAALPAPNWYDPCKRGAEFLIAIGLLVAAAPVMLLAAIVVKLTSRGPAVYSQTRVGRYGQPYTIYKIRTMVNDCEKASGVRWATTHDPRITTVGRFLRKTHIDELPQLWNVIRGDMSLIGPRPERPEFTAHLEKAIPHYSERLAIRPGMTGLALRLPDTDLNSVRRKLTYDLYYVRRASPTLDVQILIATACYLVGVPGPLPSELP